MSIRENLEFRKLDEGENRKCQFDLDVARIETAEDCLENNLESFLELTYPSQLIKDLIEFINSSLKNNKMRYKDNGGTVILYGGHGLGKSHALMTAYSLFRDFDIAADWLDNHNIKFNKFNAFAIKNKSKSCIISLLDETEDKMWVPIFEKLEQTNLLGQKDKVPNKNTLRKLAKDEDVAIFIDDFEKFFNQLQKNNEDVLLEDNKLFIKNLLKEASKNENLIVFIATLGAEETIKEIFPKQEVIIKYADNISQRNDFIFYHLFDQLKNDQFRTNVDPSIDKVLEEYESTSISILNPEKFREELIASYPFHPDLLAILKNIYRVNFAQIKDGENEISILKDLIEQYKDKELLVLSDLPLDIFETAFSKLNNALEAELKNVDLDTKKYYQRILKTIFFYTIDNNNRATKENILKAIIRPGEENNINQILSELNELLEQGNYIGINEDIYFIKPKKSLNTLIQEQIENISEQETRGQLKEYIRNYVFNSNYQFYEDNSLTDNGEFSYLLLLDKIDDKNQLENLLNQQVYDNLTYENSFVFITASEDIVADKHLDLVQQVIAIRKVIDYQVGEEKEKLQEQLKGAEAELIDLLKESFGSYLQWVTTDNGESKLEQVDFELKNINNPQDIVIDKGAIKDYILNIEQEVIQLDELLDDMKKNRYAPFVPGQEVLYEVIEDLEKNEGFIFVEETKNIYKSLSALLEGKMKEVSDDAAKNKLVSHLKYDLFKPDYKIYGRDEIPDEEQLQFVILIADLIEDDNERKFLEEKIYNGRNYQNRLLLMKSNTNIFTEENIKKVKKEISLEKLAKEWEQRERVMSLLEEQNQEVIKQLEGSFGIFINWSYREEKLELEKSNLAVSNFNIEKLIKNKTGFLKEAIMSIVDKLKSSIQVEDFLLEFKKNRAKPIIDDQSFYKLIEELEDEGRIYIDQETNQLYSNFLISIQEKVEGLDSEQVEERIINFIQEKLFSSEYKVYGYHQLEDNPQMKYLLLLDDKQDELVEFLNQEFYEQFEFQNSQVVIRPKKDVFRTEIRTKVEKLIAVDNLLEQNEGVAYASELLADLREEIINNLKDSFGYYEEWVSSEDGIKLVEEEIDPVNITKQIEVDLSELKDHLMANLRERKVGIDSEELFLDYRRFRDYPLIVEKNLFDQALEELIADQKIISGEGETQVYGNTSALIKSTVQQVDSKDAKQRLVLYIRDELFNEEYSVFGYDQLEDDAELKYLLLLGSFQNKDKLQQVLEKKLYQDREYKNNIVLYSSREDVFDDKYVAKMRLVMGVEQAQEKINWNQNQIGRILEKRKESLNQLLKDTFGDYLYWEARTEKLELVATELEAKLSTAELARAIKADLEIIKEDIIERLKELAGITKEELLAHYKKFRDYPLLIEEQDFYQALEELKDEEKIIIEENKELHLNPLIVAEELASDFAISEVKRELAYFIRDNLFKSHYKIYGYDQLEDSPELEYVLLLDAPEENLVEFLNQEIYEGFEFENSEVVIRPTENPFTDEVLAKIRKLMAVNKNIASKSELEYYEKIVLDLKAEIIIDLEDRFAYYEKWTSSEEGFKLEEKKIDLAKVDDQIQVESTELKEHLVVNLRERKLGIEREELFLEYRRFRDYPLIVEADLFDQVLDELITAEEIISNQASNQVYGSTDSLIKSVIQKIDSTEVRERLVSYIRNELFDGEYSLLGYDQITDNSDLKYLLVLDDFENKDKLEQTLNDELYQDREYKNNIVLYSVQENVFQEKYMDMMRSIIGVEQAQANVKGQEKKIRDDLKQRKKKLNQELQDVFGNHLYWEDQTGELELATTELEAPLSTAELAREIKADLEIIKEDIIERLKELAGITKEELLAHYKKFRDYPLLTEEQLFYQALEELEELEKVIVEENNELYLSPLIVAEEKIDNFTEQEVEQRLAYFIRDNLFNSHYKIYGYDQLEDSPELEYVLLLDAPEEDLVEFLNQEIYEGLEFENSEVVIRPTGDIYTDQEVLTKMRKLMAMENLLEQADVGEKSAKLLADLKEILISKLKDKFAYYEGWSSAEDEIKLVEQEINPVNIREQLEADFDDLKEHLVANLRERKLGIEREELFLEYRRFRDHPLIVEKNLFDQALEELIADQNIISGEGETQVYGNTSALIKSTVQQVDNKDAKQRLVLYIRNELFNGEYSVFGYDQLADDEEVKYLLLLGSFQNKDKLQQVLEQKLYQDREYKNNIVLYSSREDVFDDKYVAKMRLVMGVEQAQEKINWEQNQIGRILEKRKEDLNQLLKDTFGDYLHWEARADQLALATTELEAKLSTAELVEAIKPDLESIKEDIVERLKELAGITKGELLDHYKKFRDYLVMLDEQEFHQILDELEAEEKIIIEENNKLYLNPLVVAEEKVDNFAGKEVKQELAYFIRDNLFDSDFKIYGYDQLEDSPELEYVLLLDAPEENLVEFLNQEIYKGFEFQNSEIIIRSQADLFTTDILNSTRKIMTMRSLLEQTEVGDRSVKLLADLKEELTNKLKGKFGYYEAWFSSEDGIKLVEQEIDLVNIREQLEVDFSQLKEHLMVNLRERKLGIEREELFLDYRRFRDYPLIIEDKQFYQALEELIKDQKIISGKEDDQVYGTTSALIKSTVQQVDNKEAKQRLVLYIRNELFNGEYSVFGYDQLADDEEVKYLLLLGSFQNKDKLQQVLEQKLYQDREYKNNIVLYSSREDVFDDKYVAKMRLVMGVEQAQEKINWEQNQIGRILEKRKEDLNQLLKDTFGDYLHWEARADQLALATTELEAKLSTAELVEAIKPDLESIKDDIVEHLKELAGITSQELLTYYKKDRKYPLIIEDEQFYQALKELKNEQRIISEHEQLYSCLEGLVESKFDKVSTEQAEESLINYSKENLFDDNYHIYGYDEIADDVKLKYVALVEYFEQQEELESFLKNQVYADRKYKGNLAIITPKENITDHLDLMKKVLAIKDIDSDNQLVTKLLEVTEKKLRKRLKESFGNYIQWVTQEEKLKLKLKEIKLSNMENNIKTNKSELEEYILNKVRGKIKISHLLLEFKKNLGTP
ncbi:MAG: hypothetical protein ACQEP9_02630, partial [Bacillota bacterium]